MNRPEDVGSLVEEYRALFDNSSCQQSASLDVELIEEAEWSAEAAEHLLDLAHDNGSFILRNALAVSLALGIEDGKRLF